MEQRNSQDEILGERGSIHFRLCSVQFVGCGMGKVVCMVVGTPHVRESIPIHFVGPTCRVQKKKKKGQGNCLRLGRSSYPRSVVAAPSSGRRRRRPAGGGYVSSRRRRGLIFLAPRSKKETCGCGNTCR